MRRIDTKYQIKDSSIYKYDGTKIPDDEPLFLFRAQDKLLPEVLEYYRQLRLKNGTKPEELKRMDDQIKVIKDWQKTNYTQFPR